MDNKDYWREELRDLSAAELNEVIEVANELKASSGGREEFMDMLKRWKEKYPKAKYFYTGGEWKGDYECRGDWGAYTWMDVPHYGTLYELRGMDKDDLTFYSESGGDIEILDEFETLDDFKAAVLNTYLDDPEFNQFEEEFDASLHAPIHKTMDAEDLENGDIRYEFMDIETGLKFYLYDRW